MKRAGILLGVACAWTIVFAAAGWGADTANSAEPALSGVPGVPGVRGLVIPDKQVVLNAPLDGIVAKILVKEGDAVTEGQVLALMDDLVQQRAVDAAKLQAENSSDIRQAELVVAEQTITTEKSKEAYDKGAASEWEWRREQLRLDQAKASLQSAHEKQAIAVANWKLEEEKLAHYKVKAPFTGRIIRTNTEAGATLNHTDPLLSMAALSPILAQVNVPAEQYGQIKLGQVYHLQAESPVNRMLDGKCKTIDPVIDAASRTFRCVFIIENPDQALPAGFKVNLMRP